METDLRKVLKQKVPYHAHVYPKYKPVTGSNPDRDLQELFKKAVQIEMDDDHNNGSRDENALLAKIERAHIIVGTEEHEDCELDVYCHESGCFSDTMEERIRRNGWSIKNFKIFHIWSIRVNEKLGYFPWTAKFQPWKNEIKVEIHSEEENENEISKGRVVDLIINPDDCDRILTVTIDDCKVDYSVFGDAWRVELEIRLYEVDGSPALNFSGRIHAYFCLGEAEHDVTFLDGEYNEESATVFRKMLILPSRIEGFFIEMELQGNLEKFWCRYRRFIISRSVPIDEQHYVCCCTGYMLLTIKWGCCCVEEGLCVCPGTSVCGIETFGKLSKSSEESGEDSEGVAKMNKIGGRRE